jgi:glycosyltransferase involved in cell wall biosynthesis
MNDPRVSVVLPVRNGEATVGRAIDSILEQTYGGFELVVVDDGSEDGTAAVVAAYADPRLHVVRTPHIGLGPALRLGMAESRGEIIARQDADDVSFPERVQRQLELFDRMPGAVVIGVDWEERDGAERLMRQRRPFVGGMLGRSLLLANPVFHGAVAFRRQAAEQVGGYDATFRFAQDYDLWLRMAEVGAVYNHPEVLATRYMDGTNIAARHEQAQHREALRARLATCRRRRDPVLWPLLIRGAVSVVVPPRVKRPVRRIRGQVP